MQQNKQSSIKSWLHFVYEVNWNYAFWQEAGDTLLKQRVVSQQLGKRNTILPGHTTRIHMSGLNHKNISSCAFLWFGHHSLVIPSIGNRTKMLRTKTLFKHKKRNPDLKMDDKSSFRATQKKNSERITRLKKQQCDIGYNLGQQRRASWAGAHRSDGAHSSLWTFFFHSMESRGQTCNPVLRHRICPTATSDHACNKTRWTMPRKIV